MRLIPTTGNKMIIEGNPEELVLFSKLIEEWDMFYGELKARGLSLMDIVTERNKAHATDFLNFVIGNKDKEDK